MNAVDRPEFNRLCDEHELAVAEKKGKVAKEIQQLLQDDPTMSKESVLLLWEIRKQCEDYTYRPSIEDGRPEGLLKMANRMLDTAFKNIILWELFAHPDMKKEIKKAETRTFKCRKKRQGKCKDPNSCEHSKGCIDKYAANFLVGKFKTNAITGKSSFEKEYQEHLDWVLSTDDYPLSFENCLLNRDNLDPTHARRLLKSLNGKPMEELIGAHERYVGVDDDFVEFDSSDDDWSPVEFEGNVPDTVVFDRIKKPDELAGTTTKAKPKPKKTIVVRRTTASRSKTMAAIAKRK